MNDKHRDLRAARPALSCCAVLALGALALGCAAVTPAALPPLPRESSAEMQGAYRGVEKAYGRCTDRYLDAQVPWQFYAAIGAGAVSLASIGSATAVGTLAPDDGGRVAAIAGFGVLGLGTAVAASLFGEEAWTQYQRREAYRQVLREASGRTAEAIGDGSAMGMTELTRVLNEECRVVSAATGSASAFPVLQDEARWREHVAKLEAERSLLRQQRSDSKDKLSAALERQRAQGERLRSLEDALAARESQNAALRGEMARLEEEQASLSKRQQQLLEEKRKLEEQTTSYAEMAEALAQEVQQGRVALRRLRNGVVVEMQNKVLFPSGSAELNDTGKETLRAVAGAIKELKERRVRIEGHTDNVPVGRDLPYASNWELSAARALTVTKFLQEEGVDPSIMSAEARSKYAPIASNKTTDGRARNRRIEIYLVPKPTGSKEAVDLGERVE